MVNDEIINFIDDAYIDKDEVINNIFGSHNSLLYGHLGYDSLFISIDLFTVII